MSERKSLSDLTLCEADSLLEKLICQTQGNGENAAVSNQNRNKDLLTSALNSGENIFNIIEDLKDFSESLEKLHFFSLWIPSDFLRDLSASPDWVLKRYDKIMVWEERALLSQSPVTLDRAGRGKAYVWLGESHSRDLKTYGNTESVVMMKTSGITEPVVMMGPKHSRSGKNNVKTFRLETLC